MLFQTIFRDFFEYFEILKLLKIFDYKSWFDHQNASKQKRNFNLNHVSHKQNFFSYFSYKIFFIKQIKLIQRIKIQQFICAHDLLAKNTQNYR